MEEQENITKEVVEKKPKSKYQRVYDALMMVALWFFIALLLITIVTIINYKDIISKDPLNYGMDLHNFTSCTCHDTEGKLWESMEEGGFKHTEQGESFPYKLIK